MPGRSQGTRKPPTRGGLPYFKLWTADFLAGTSEMTPAEVGHYIRLLCNQWERGGLPDDLAKLGRMAGAGLHRSWPTLQAKFPIGPDGLRRNARLERVRVDEQAYSAAQSERAKSRWNQSGDDAGADAGAYAESMPPQPQPQPGGNPTRDSPSGEEPLALEARAPLAADEALEDEIPDGAKDEAMRARAQLHELDRKDRDRILAAYDQGAGREAPGGSVKYLEHAWYLAPGVVQSLLDERERTRAIAAAQIAQMRAQLGVAR